MSTAPGPFAHVDRRTRLKSRGYCVGSVVGCPVPGSVGLDKRAACSVCGKRVKVTVRGLFAHHIPAATPRRP